MGILTTLIRSITGYVQGIITSKQNLRNSIIGKEVDVPESAKLAEYPSYVDKIRTDGIDTTDATAKSSDMRDGVTAYVNDEKVTGNIPTRTSADLEIDGAKMTVPAGIYDAEEKASVQYGTVHSAFLDKNGNGFVLVGAPSASGVVTAMFGIQEGYFEKTTWTGSFNLDTIESQTFIPTDEEQTIVPAGKYVTGDIKIAPAPKVSGQYAYFTDDVQCDGAYMRIFLNGYPMSSVKTLQITCLSDSIVPANTIYSISIDRTINEAWMFTQKTSSVSSESLDGDQFTLTEVDGYIILNITDFPSLSFNKDYKYGAFVSL